MTDDLQGWLSPSLFALAALSFLLPFATVSCDDARTTFTGIQLVTRTVPRGGVVHGAQDCSGDLSVCVERAAAGTATVALVAALAGLLLGVLGIGRGPGWCALVGLGAVIALPFEGGLSGPDVTTHSGYDLALLVFGCVWFLHVCHAALSEPRAVRPRKEEFHMRKTIVPLLGALLVLVAGAAAAAADPGGATPDVRLLATYEPVMQFDPLERFQPVKVQSFLTDAVVSDGNLDQSGCTPSAALGGLDCYTAAAATGGGPTIYGHVVHEDGDIVLQYWAFYYDDVYSYTYPASDFIWQAHEGDWEVVNVVLGGDEQPLYVGYSQHCSGQRHAWAATTRAGDTHPVVHVAFGSHANYFTSGTHPVDVNCIPPAAVAILQRNHLPLPVDYAFDGGATAGPPHSGGQVMPIEQIGDDGRPWVQFAGTWGEAQYFHAPAPIGTVAFGTSPVGPAFHPDWTDPLGTLATWPDAGN